MKLVHSKLRPGQVIMAGNPRIPHVILGAEPGRYHTFMYLQPHNVPKAEVAVRRITGMRELVDLPVCQEQRALVMN